MTSPHRLGPPRPGRSGAAGVLAAAVLWIVLVPAAGAIGLGGAFSFSAIPVPLANGTPRSYFELTVPAGTTAADQVLITNNTTATRTLRIDTAKGITAANSGSAFVNEPVHCASTSCWLSGLPSSVTLGPQRSEQIGFRVTIPRGTSSRQYLAGITVEPATPSAPVTVGGNGSATARAVVVSQVTVGVAVTVGNLNGMRTGLAATGLAGGAVGPVARLSAKLRNTGQTFVHGSGTISCAVGPHQAVFPITVSTILPGDTAVVPVNAPGLPLGSQVRCVVSASFGDGQHTAAAFEVAIPSASHPTIIHTGKGVYSTLPGGIPWWAVALIVLGVVLVVLMASVLVVMARRHRAESGDQPTPGTAAIEDDAGPETGTESGTEQPHVDEAVDPVGGQVPSDD